MKRLLLVVALLATLPFLALTMRPIGSPHPPVVALASSSIGGMETSDPLDAVRGGAAEPPDMVLGPGDRAPDFGYDTEDGEALHLHDVLAQGHVFLVFQPSPPQLAQLEHERLALQKRGITVVAIMDRSERATRTLAQKLELHYIVIPDPRAVIGGQFNVLGPNTRRPEPAWFAIDRSGTIRALQRWHIPDADYASLAATALHLAAPDAVAPSAQEERGPVPRPH